MPRFEPFRGLRYDPAIALDQVIAPPYDVIDDEERQRLSERHPENSVLLELPRSDSGGDPYEHARELLAGWRRRGVLRLDGRPSFYVYRMTTPAGETTTGVLGALGLTAADVDDVHPHEQTLPKPLGDRLHLLRATRANISPIWALSRSRELSPLLARSDPPGADAVDDQGVRHQLWALDDEVALSAIAAAVSAAPLVIADGHHRYQTARAYHEERGDAASGSIMAYVVELSPGELHVGAIHRVVREASGLDGSKIVDALRRRFQAVRAGPLSPAVIGALEESQNLALLTSSGAWLLTPLPDADDAGHEDRLDPELVTPVLEELGAGEVGHVHSAEEAAEEVRSGSAQAAVLLRPVSVELIARWADERRQMPPKTTYFHPKPRTGMVLRLLDAPGNGAGGDVGNGAGDDPVGGSVDGPGTA
jgi:uncharacterized protein (DUF1015 family)